MGKLFLNVGVITAVIGGVRTLRATRQVPTNWRRGLMIAGAGIAVVLAVADALLADRDEEARAAGELEK